MSKPQIISKDGTDIHISVGAVIERGGKYLLIERNVPPPGFAGPAGHVDQDETPEVAVVREVMEEVGLRVTENELLFHEFVDTNWCSHGVTGHDWFLYSCNAEGEVTADPHEAKSYAWYTPEEIRKLTLEPVWEYWFKKMNLL